MSLTSICAWCGVVLRQGDPEQSPSHGICVGCVAESGLVPVEDLSALDQAALDAIPYGIIRLDAEGRVVAYNLAESELSRCAPEQVLGKRFFEEVAPCADTETFQGRLQRLQAAGEARSETFHYLFRFKHGQTLVRIAMAYDPRDASATLMITQAEELSPGAEGSASPRSG